MDAEGTIDRIKKLEEWGKKQVEQAELDRNEVLAKARVKATGLVETFEKSRESELQKTLADTEKDAKKTAHHTTIKAENEAESTRKKATARVSETSAKLFEDFKKSLKP